MKDNILPEEKLLRLIRTSKKTKDTIEPADDAQLKPASQKAAKKKPFVLNLPHLSLNRLVKLIFAASLFYLIVSAVHPVFISGKIDLPEMETKEKTAVKKETFLVGASETIKPYDFYLQGINQRKIFSSAAADLEKPIGTVSADLIKDINLVGIISAGDGAGSAQAIIEDKKAQKTYYLSAGQFIGQLQLGEILEGKIILNYEGQRYELYL